MFVHISILFFVFAALVYEVLYVRVFKLPDVMYSVERMLHDPNGKAMKIIEGTDKNGDVIEEKIFTYEGREFILDTPGKHSCTTTSCM